MKSKRSPSFYSQVNVPADVPLVPDGRGGVRAATAAELEEYRVRNGLPEPERTASLTGTEIPTVDPDVIGSTDALPESGHVYHPLELINPALWRALGSPRPPRVPLVRDVGRALDKWDPNR